MRSPRVGTVRAWLRFVLCFCTYLNERDEKSDKERRNVESARPSAWISLASLKQRTAIHHTRGGGGAISRRPAALSPRSRTRTRLYLGHCQISVCGAKGFFDSGFSCYFDYIFRHRRSFMSYNQWADEAEVEFSMFFRDHFLGQSWRGFEFFVAGKHTGLSCTVDVSRSILGKPVSSRNSIAFYGLSSASHWRFERFRNVDPVSSTRDTALSLDEDTCDDFFRTLVCGMYVFAMRI